MSYETEVRRDRLRWRVYFAVDPLTRGVDAVAEIVQQLERHGLAPTMIRVKGTRKKLTPERLRAALAPDGKYAITVALSRDNGPELSAELWLRADSPIPYGLTFSGNVELAYFAGADGRERSDAFYRFLESVCAVDDPVYGFAHSRADHELSEDGKVVAVEAPTTVPEAFWLLVLGPAMVDAIGRDRVMSTPAARIDALPGGGVIMMTTTESPVDVTSPVSRRAQAAVLAHLRPDLSVEQALARTAERDLQLAPVERDWDPDLAELLELICDEVPFSKRQAEIARFNGYRPPPVSEVRDDPPVAQGELAPALARIDTQAEQLVALLHTKVKGVSPGSPAVLPWIDLHFWRYDYPGTFERAQIDKRLVPALGAYLGDVLVRELGGTWVPRVNPDETAVVVGGRAWLPFLRARHFFTSKQAVLDHSLTKFFKVAARGG